MDLMICDSRMENMLQVIPLKEELWDGSVDAAEGHADPEFPQLEDGINFAI